MSKKGRPELPTSPERRRAFLDAYRATASFAEACRITAGPHAEDKPHGTPPCYSTWRALIARDPEFAAAYRETQELIKDDIRAEIYRRAVSRGQENLVYQKGVQVFNADGTPAKHVTKSDRLLIKLAASLMPEFRDRQEISVTHNVRSAISWAITGDDLALLTTDEKATLSDLIHKLRSRRAEVARLEDQRTEAIEVEYQEVEETEYCGSEEDPIPW